LTTINREQSELYVALDQNYIGNDEFHELYALAKHTGSKGGAFIKYLKNNPRWRTKIASHQKKEIFNDEPGTKNPEQRTKNPERSYPLNQIYFYLTEGCRRFSQDLHQEKPD